MGRSSSDGTRDCPARCDLGKSSAVRLGMAKSAAFLRRGSTARPDISSSITCCATRPIADILLIVPRTEEIIAALRRNPPELIFTGYAPFRALKELYERALSSLAADAWLVDQERRFWAI